MKKELLIKLKALISFSLVVVLCLGFAVPISASNQDSDVIYISTANDLVELSNNSTYDKWSLGKTVVLMNDISLKGVDYKPIPYFSGIFDGQGYEISDFEVDGRYYPAGLFGITGPTAIIKNLTVSGAVIPSGDNSNVGGIVGENRGVISNSVFNGVVSGDEFVGGLVGINDETGSIINSSVKGNIFGEFSTGGIVGKNLGTVLDCTNYAYVNNTSEDATIDISEIGINLLLDMYAINSSDIMNAATDTGGIAGYSAGIISGCVNRETIGYARVGYNVGGIVGRNSGYINDCVNYGDVLGRKDIGGIVGQAEPFTLVETTASQLAIVEGQMTVLETQLDTLVQHTKSLGSSTKSIMSRISTHMSDLRVLMDELSLLLDEQNKQAEKDLKELEDTLEKVEVKLIKIEKCLEELEVAINGLDKVMDGIEDRTFTELNSLKENVSNLEKTIEELQKKLESMEGFDSLESLEVLYDSLEELTGMMETLAEMLESFASYVEFMDQELAKVSKYREEIEESVREITEYLKDIKEILDEFDMFEKIDQLQDFQKTATRIMNEITNKMDLILDELDLLMNVVDDYSTQIDEDLLAIETQIHLISNTLKGTLDENPLEDTIVTEVTVEDIQISVYGKIETSTNYADIEGEFNVGGIAGNMSLEHEQDPEDELSTEYSWRERKTYELKSILYNCINKGNVTAKKDVVGAICGQLDIGLISDCYGYGNVVSETGGYVGGIAGIARTTVISSVANCGLSGNTYVGGIIGTGFEAVDGKSVISNCYSMVEIDKCQQFAGAIAGTYIGSFKNNYFVSDTLQGINRVSYEGIAEAIPYEQLLKVTNIPEELEKFTLSFVVDNRVIKAVEFKYGDSFGADVFPDIPKKDGYQGTWDINDLSNLCFDTVVTAEYIQYVSALKSDVTRDNGRPVYLIEGNFNSEDKITAKLIENTDSISSEFNMSGKVVEYWKISFSDDGQKRHSLRFLPAKNLENAKLYIKENNEWVRVDTEDFGSYKTFQVVGNELELAVIPIRYDIITWIIIALITIVVLGLVIHIERKKRIISNGIKWIINKYSIKKILVSFVVCGVIIGTLSMFYIARLPKVQISTELASILTDVLTTQNQSMKIDLMLDIDDTHIELDSDLYVLNESDSSVFVLTKNNHSIYMSDDALVLENGKAYKVNSSNNRNLLELVHTLFEVTETLKTEELDKTIYTIEAHDENAEALMSVLVPSTEGQLANAKNTIVRIIAKDDILESIEVEGSATLRNSTETEIQAQMIISNFSEVNDYKLPDKIKNVILNVDTNSLPAMSEDMYRLLLAFVDFNAKAQSGLVKVNVSSGSINIDVEQDFGEFVSQTSKLSSTSQIDKIPDLIYEICLNGDFSSEKIGSSYVFSVKLDGEDMNQLAMAIVPEIALQNVNFTNGLVEVMVVDNEISSFVINIDGTTTILVSKIDASIDVTFDFD